MTVHHAVRWPLLYRNPSLQGLGASLVVNDAYASTPAFAKLIADVAPASLGINGAGGAPFSAVAKALAQSATLVTYAAVSRQPVRVGLGLLTQK